MSYYSLPLTATDDSDPEHLHTPVDTPYYYPPPEPDHACTWQSSGVMPYGATPKIVTGSGSYISDLPYNGHHLAAAAIPSDDQLNSYAGTGVRRSGFDDSMRSNMQQGLGHHRGYPYKLNPEAAQGYSHDDYYADSGYGDSRSEDLLAHDTAARLEGNSHLISSRHGLTQASPASDYGHGHGTRHPGFALTSANFEAHAAVPGPAYVGAHAQYETASHHYNEELQYPNIDPHATSLVSSRTPYALDDPHTPDLVLEEPGHSFEVTQQPHSLSTLPQGHGYHPDPFVPRLRVDTQHLPGYSAYAAPHSLDHESHYVDPQTYQYSISNSPGASPHHHQIADKLHSTRTAYSGVSYIEAPRPMRAPRQLQPYGDYEDGSIHVPPVTHTGHRVLDIPVAEPPPLPPPQRNALLIEDQPKRPLTLACHFCRRRKIACVSPPPGSKDRTCGQCAKRGQECTYPTESRRGIRQKPNQSEEPGQQQAAGPEQGQASGSAPAPSYSQVSRHDHLTNMRPMAPLGSTAGLPYP